MSLIQTKPLKQALVCSRGFKCEFLLHEACTQLFLKMGGQGVRPGRQARAF